MPSRFQLKLAHTSRNGIRSPGMKKVYQIIALAIVTAAAAIAQLSDRQVLKQETPEYPA